MEAVPSERRASGGADREGGVKDGAGADDLANARDVKMAGKRGEEGEEAYYLRQQANAAGGGGVEGTYVFMVVSAYVGVFCRQWNVLRDRCLGDEVCMATWWQQIGVAHHLCGYRLALPHEPASVVPPHPLHSYPPPPPSHTRSYNSWTFPM